MQRRLFILVFLAVVAVLAGCKETLYTDLSEREVNEMLAVLQGNGIDASKRAGGEGRFQLSVAEGHLAPAVSLLRDRGYPSQKFTNMGEVFSGDGLLASPQEEWARYVYALSQSLSETITEIDGVITARVHLVLPNNDPKAAKGAPSAASIFIEYNPQTQVEAAKADIKRIVEKSVEGLEYDKISVVMLAAQPLLRGDEMPSLEPKPIYASAWGGLVGFGTLLACAAIFVWRRRHLPAFGLRDGSWREARPRRAADGEVVDGGDARRT